VLRLDAFVLGTQAPLHARAPCNASQAAGLFSLRRMPKTLPYRRTSSRPTPLGNYTHILAFGVAKSSLVK
jgi:hypothetical protein